MGACYWAKELESHHTKRTPTWEQSDGSLWNDPNVGYWEIAKLYIEQHHCEKGKVGASEAGINALFDVLSMCDRFKTNAAVVQKCRSIRSMWAPCPWPRNQ